MNGPDWTRPPSRPHEWPRGQARGPRAILRRAALRSAVLVLLLVWIIGFTPLRPCSPTALLLGGVATLLAAHLLIAGACAAALAARGHAPGAARDAVAALVALAVGTAAVAQAPIQLDYVGTFLATGSPVAAASAAHLCAGALLQDSQLLLLAVWTGIVLALVNLCHLDRPASAGLVLLAGVVVELTLFPQRAGLVGPLAVLCAGLVLALHEVADSIDHRCWPVRRTGSGPTA